MCCCNFKLLLNDWLFCADINYNRRNIKETGELDDKKKSKSL